MYDEARKAIINSSPDSSVYIGADSIRFKKNGKWYARYSVVVIIHMNSNHGCKLYHKTVDLEDYGNLRQRLLNETFYAIEAATEIIEVIGDRKLEVHLDLNPSPKHKSNVAVKEALGYVKGAVGIDAKIKPASFAASHCSDHIARGKLH